MKRVEDNLGAIGTSKVHSFFLLLPVSLVFAFYGIGVPLNIPPPRLTPTNLESICMMCLLEFVLLGIFSTFRLYVIGFFLRYVHFLSNIGFTNLLGSVSAQLCYGAT